MKRKLIALDLDGTTLNNDAALSPTTIKTIQQVAAAGHIVSIVTGRPNRISQQFYDQLGLKTPMINFNGSLGHLPHKHWDKEYQYTFNREIVFDLMQHQREFDVEAMAAEGKTLFLANQTKSLVYGFFPSALTKQQVLTRQSLQQNPTSLTIALKRDAQPRFIAYVHEHYGDQVDVNSWGGPNSVIEMGAKGIQKAVGVEFLAHLYDIKREDVIAFGDEQNDNDMIEYAGTGVAMKNATAHLKAIANDETAYTNEEDGLADYLQKAFHLEKTVTA
ncbi:Cof-type HAD-IIB family hydrolase [Secundilactobacillus paracollinoides]|uniref:HAD family hydrolase n=1 Tax=Secundilactobacillus paracollinoides TaxID=240427 RepID=A0A1B2J1B4_9LACO|nr:Cof-type HAD-IIB family hydrolase [Secundilactobacillus paracollinoides]ANZ62101.1 HAD family hydrolase [Secundilactobacillus paracollinoides]ANZ68049.1 HAD family hydrolase [Secundilactobacillus paracollinoides]KRL76484.1 HAD superfamily hydrolase [Secundilactobacillus paracollinoides DSM 15502 = JCM 11969]